MPARPAVSLAAACLIAAVLIAAGLALAGRPAEPPEPAAPARVRSTSSPHAPAEAKAARLDHLHRMLRDPRTGRLPDDVRARELAYARTLPVAAAAKRGGGPALDWESAGPFDVGGRTRALAVDRAAPDRVLAGGVSGGVWLSEDRGASWTLVTEDALNLSVTALAQDPRPGFEDVWYYASGEWRGNSASDRAFRARYFGGGFYRSDDGGRSWRRLRGAGADTGFDSPFDYVSRIAVHPQTGTVFVASNATGLYRSDDGGRTFGLVLGGLNDHAWSDVAVTAGGTLVAVLSDTGTDEWTTFEAGLYRSTDDGLTWTRFAEGALPEGHDRGLLAAAPSASGVAYLFTTTAGDADGDGHEDVGFFRLDAARGTAEDRSANLPRFSSDERGRIDTQINYNMALAVAPDDPGFVVLGATNLYRSADGFATPQRDDAANWIGGYGAAPHHPDQHALVFDPADPRVLWTGNDGGVYRTDDVRAEAVAWTDLNRGYTVSQFYTVAQGDAAGDARLAGGTQDNGTPFLPGDGTSEDVSSGDGSHVYLGRAYLLASNQYGVLRRMPYVGGAPDASATVLAQPSVAAPLFIHPFAVDPADEGVVLYPDGGALWRHDALDTDAAPADGWTPLGTLPGLEDHVVTALAFTRTAPSGRLYVGASSGEGGAVPRLFRLDGAATASAGDAVDVSIPSVAPGAYVHALAVHPLDGDELLAVHSNYGVVGLYHSRDAGATWTAVEGNLAGDDARPGPSLRSAAILPWGDATLYLVGTSTGLYTTTALDGARTTWTQAAPDVLGRVVVDDVDARAADGRVAVATHGRGLFVGRPEASGVATVPPAAPGALALAPPYPNPARGRTTLELSLPDAATVTAYLVDAAGRRVRTRPGERLAPGRQRLTLDLDGLAAGAYVVVVEVEGPRGRQRRATPVTVVR